MGFPRGGRFVRALSGVGARGGRARGYYPCAYFFLLSKASIFCVGACALRYIFSATYVCGLGLFAGVPLSLVVRCVMVVLLTMVRGGVIRAGWFASFGSAYAGAVRLFVVGLLGCDASGVSMVYYAVYLCAFKRQSVGGGGVSK